MCRSSLVVCLCALHLTACDAPRVPAKALHHGEMFREVEAGELVEIDHGDGTWSYQLDEEFDVEARSVVGALTWRYVEQAIFSRASTPSVEEETFVYQPRVPQTLVEQLIGTSRVDDHGRVWEVESVDETLLIHNERPTEDVDAPSVDYVPSIDPSDQEPQPGETITWQPMNFVWTHASCQSGGGSELNIYDEESRVVVNNPGERQTTAVKVRAGGGNCSGVVVGFNWILTSAHCIYDSNNNRIGDNLITVELEWANETQVGIFDSFVPSGFTSNGTDWADDYALLELHAGFTNDPGEMNISNASDSVLQAVGVNFHNLGFPGWFPYCLTTDSFSLVHSSDNNLTGFFNETLRWTGDGTLGQSGGPVYYCPQGADDVCASGDPGAVVALFGGYNGVWQRFVGPRGANFRTWAETIIDDNTCTFCHISPTTPRGEGR